MSQTFEFYDQRARAAEAAADEAVLDNVRERELRSAKAWRGMANRQQMIDAERARTDAVRAEQRVKEAAEAKRAAESGEAPGLGGWQSRDTRAPAPS